MNRGDRARRKRRTSHPCQHFVEAIRRALGSGDDVERPRRTKSPKFQAATCQRDRRRPCRNTSRSQTGACRAGRGQRMCCGRQPHSKCPRERGQRSSSGSGHRCDVERLVRARGSVDIHASSGQGVRVGALIGHPMASSPWRRHPANWRWRRRTAMTIARFIGLPVAKPRSSAAGPPTMSIASRAAARNQVPGRRRVGGIAAMVPRAAS